jgi:hypothetical protein
MGHLRLVKKERLVNQVFSAAAKCALRKKLKAKKVDVKNEKGKVIGFYFEPQLAKYTFRKV